MCSAQKVEGGKWSRAESSRPCPGWGVFSKCLSLIHHNDSYAFETGTGFYTRNVKGVNYKFKTDSQYYPRLFPLSSLFVRRYTVTRGKSNCVNRYPVPWSGHIDATLIEVILILFTCTKIKQHRWIGVWNMVNWSERSWHVIMTIEKAGGRKWKKDDNVRRRCHVLSTQIHAPSMCLSPTLY